MKFFFSLLTVGLFLIYNPCLSQGKGVFGHFPVKLGFTMSCSQSFGKKEVYILEQNARVTPKLEKGEVSFPLSVVVLIPLKKSESLNLLINMSLADLANSDQFFNSRIPFGIGFAVFPFKSTVLGFLGFSAFCNFSYEYRMRERTIEENFFPIANYPGYNLALGTPIPEEIYKPLGYSVPTYSANAGIVLRF